MDDLRAAVSDWIGEHWLEEISMDADDDGYSYEHHESTATESADWDYDCNLQQKLVQYVREFGTEDDRDRLV